MIVVGKTDSEEGGREKERERKRERCYMDTIFFCRQCQRCCVSSGDELMPTIADFDEPASRSGRKIQRPKPLVYLDEQVRYTRYNIVTI